MKPANDIQTRLRLSRATVAGDVWQHLKTGKKVTIVDRAGYDKVRLSHHGTGRVTIKLDHYLAGDYDLFESAAPDFAKWRVVSAAMLMDDGLIVPGVRHFSPDMRAVLHRIYGEGYHRRVKEQGFIDAGGNFLSRKAAWRYADYHGQIFIRSGNNRLWRQSARMGEDKELFSENLY
jgi:hypothetical protein